MSGDEDRARIAEDIAGIDSLWEFDNPAATESKFRLLLQRALAADLARDDIDLLRTQLARTLSLQQRFEDAHALLDSLCPSSNSHDELASRPPPLAVRYLLERGRTLNSAGRRAEAATIFLLAWERARIAGLDALAIDAAHMLAIAADDSDQSLHWNDTALRLAESTTEPKARGWRGSLRNNLGWSWHQRGDFERALRHFEAALECRRERGDPRQIAIARWCKARCLRSLGRLGEALAIQQDLLAEHENRATADGFVHEEIGECLLSLGRPAEARPHFVRALDLLARDHALAHREPQRLERLRKLGSGDP